jgi:hypothetical protein
MPQASSKKRIVLWGNTQVGKTALLATALYGRNPELSEVHVDASAKSGNYKLFEVWRRLRNNQWVPSTKDPVTVKLTTRIGCEVELVDVRGGMTLEFQQEGVADLIQGADAVLFLVRYDSDNSADEIAAIEGACLEIQASASDKPTALALTQCELHLKFEDAAWSDPGQCLRSCPLWATHEATLRRFERVVWPTSSYGYEPETRLPALILGEMGQLLPYRIDPLNVAKPLAYLLRKLGCL